MRMRCNTTLLYPLILKFQQVEEKIIDFARGVVEEIQADEEGEKNQIEANHEN